jgi:ATP-dependent DNA ligase
MSVTGDGVFLQSRSFKPLAAYFPDVVEYLAGLSAGTVLDGELVNFDATAGALLRHRQRAGAPHNRSNATNDTGRARTSPARPRPAVTRRCSAENYVRHDLGGDLRDLPLLQRRARLRFCWLPVARAHRRARLVRHVAMRASGFCWLRVPCLTRKSNGE